MSKELADKDASIADLAAKLKRAVEVARSVEHRGMGHRPSCPCCGHGSLQFPPHAPDCPLEAVIKENP